MSNVNFALRKWLKTMTMMYKLTGTLPQYIIDDFTEFIVTVPEDRKKRFYAYLRYKYLHLLPFLPE